MQSQSFISTLMRGHMGIYETRIFMLIVDRCQDLLGNDSFTAKAYKVPSGWSYRFAFSVGDLTSSHNYNYAKKACENLKNLTVQHYDEEKKVWEMAGLITQAKIERQTGILACEVASWVVDYIIDFRKGWRTYDLERAKQIRNPYTLRMYLLTCSQSRPLSYEITTLRDTLLGPGSHKYTLTNAFIKRCIIPAMQELAEKKLNGFTIKAIKEGRGPKAKITRLLISPVKRESRDVNISEQRKEMAQEVPAALLNYFTLQLGFTTRELKGKNLETLKRFTRDLPNWQTRLLDIIQRQRMHRYGHGWIINAIKRECGIIKDQ